MNLNLKTKEHIDLKATKQNVGKEVVSMVALGEATILLFREDLSMKSFKVCRCEWKS